MEGIARFTVLSEGGLKRYPWYKARHRALLRAEGTDQVLSHAASTAYRAHLAGESWDEAARLAMAETSRYYRRSYSAEASPDTFPSSGVASGATSDEGSAPRITVLEALANERGRLTPSAEDEYFDRHSEAGPASAQIASVLNMLTDRQRKAIEAYAKVGSFAEAGRLIGTTRFDVHSAVTQVRRIFKREGIVPNTAVKL